MLDAVLPLVEKELREVAEKLMVGERRDHTLQATALINEAYVRLVNQKQASYRDRAHFIGVAAKKMREILLDYGRRRSAGRRPEGNPREPLSRVVIAVSHAPSGVCFYHPKS